MFKHYTVREMYDYCVENNLKLLSNSSLDFWSEYLQNSDKYDNLFMKEHASFRYYFDNENANLSDVVENFIMDVEVHLLLNAKKYNELYRVYTLSATNNNFLQNYSIDETINKDVLDINNNTYGSRMDSTDETLGSRTDTSEREVAGYNGSDYANDNKVTDTSGQQLNGTDFTKGQQIDQLSDTIDEDITRNKTGIFNTTTPELLKKHLSFWDMYRFYAYIFMQISKELLLV